MRKREDTAALATFGAGCFWDSEAALRRLEGVITTRVGFMGGKAPQPTYEDVCSGTTGHVEVVQVVYDPLTITFDTLLDTFWSIVISSSPEPCSGTVESQYPPVIFFHSKEQETAARGYLERRQRPGDFMYRGIAEISPASEFYEAEECHQQFYEKCGRGYTAVPRFYE